MSYFYIINFLIIYAFMNCQCQTNQWTKDIGPNGEDIWRSTSDFIPVQSQSFGTIQLGQIMTVEFDFIWYGRTNDPRAGYYENFFRVGYDAAIADNCYGEGARYPSFWLTNDINTMHISVSSGAMCQPSQSLTAYGVITIGVSYHIKIFFNETQLRVDVTGGNKANWSKIWPRSATQKQFLGDQVPVWWMTNTFSGSEFNRGNATFSNIVMISKLLTADPTTFPTASPTTAIPTVSTVNPTNNPTVAPTETTSKPTNNPTTTPSYAPSEIPTNTPSFTPTRTPSLLPTTAPTSLPTNTPSLTHTLSLTTTTSLEPTSAPVYGPLIECKHNEDCNILCKHPFDCNLRNVLCPKTNHQCNVYCAEYACQYITINAHFIHGGKINVHCNGTKSCFAATIDVQHSINTTLNVQLSNANALSNANIYCADLQCNIRTIDDFTSFEGLLNSHIISQENTQRLSLSVNGNNILKNATIQCPQQHSVCQIIVGNDNQTYSNLLTDAVIQSHGGLDDIQLLSGNDIDDTPRIECGANYEYSCDTKRIYGESGIHWRCQDNIYSDFVCDNTDYIELICVITGGDTLLMNKQVQNIEELVVSLDGDTFSYDPWMEMRGRTALNKSHLSFKWNCKYKVGTITTLEWIDCSQMFKGLDQQSVVYAHFDSQTIVANEYYVYQYTLNVTDSTNPKRMCANTPSVTVSISTIPNEEGADIEIPLLVASIQQLDHDYAQLHDHIRLIGKLTILDGTDVDQYFYKYFWNEISGQLSENKLEMISNSIHQKNLIIDSVSLMEGNEYEFQLVVEQYEDSSTSRNYIQRVRSQSVSIMVTAPDVSVVNSSVIIDDNCILNPIKLETLHQLFDVFFNITFKGEDAAKNRYQFGYSIADYMDNQKILLHSSLITSATHFNHFVLPLSSSIIFHVEILDEYHKSVEINTTQFCMIQIEHEYNEYACISYKEDVYDTFKPSGASTASYLEQKQLFAIQTSHSVLHLLQTQSVSISDTQCKQQYMKDVLDIMSAEFADLCQSDFVLQVAQVLTNWIEATLSDSYLSEVFIESMGSMYLEALYDLSVQVLDPCLSFIDIQEHEIIACSDSVITSQSAVCYKGDSVALHLSRLFSTDRYLYIFLSFMESLINIFDRTSQIQYQFEFSTDLFSLIRKSLYVYQLLGLSVSIPYERFIYDSNTFQLCSHRTINENVECNASDISVVLTANDTKEGKKELHDIDPDLNGVDISVIFLRTNKSTAFVFDPCSHEKQQNELQGRSASVVLSSGVNTSNLTSNVSIAFSSFDAQQTIKCVWYDEESSAWDTSGCSTIIDEDNGRVLCSCSHLTTFSTIKFVYNDCLDVVDRSPSISNYPYVSNLIFLILFFCLFSKITSDFILIFDGGFVKRFKKHQKDGALSGPGSVYICTLFDLLVCIEFHIAFLFEWDWHKPILIFTLLLPLLSFCWMFLCILRTWIRITHSFGSDTIFVHRIEKGMVVFMVLFVSFVAVETVLIYLQHNYYIYGEIIWCFIMSIFTITYLIYATAAIRTIWKSLMAVKNDIINQKDDQDTKLLSKLLIVSLLLAIYFLIKTFLSIYLVSHHEHSFVWRVVDMVMEFTSLCIIYCLYNGGIKRLVTKYDNMPICIKCYRKCKHMKPMKPRDEITPAPAMNIEMKQKSDDTDRNPRKRTHAPVVSQSIEGSISTTRPATRRNIKLRASRRRNRRRRPQMIQCPSATATASMDTAAETPSINTSYRTPTLTASNRRSGGKRHKSSTGSFTLSLSALPTLSQMESGLEDPSSSGSVDNHRQHHMQQRLHSSSSYESSLFSQFSNAARTRFPSSCAFDVDAPLAEQSDCFQEESSHKSINLASDPDPDIIPRQQINV